MSPAAAFAQAPELSLRELASGKTRIVFVAGLAEKVGEASRQNPAVQELVQLLGDEAGQRATVGLVGPLLRGRQHHKGRRRLGCQPSSEDVLASATPSRGLGGVGLWLGAFNSTCRADQPVPPPPSTTWRGPQVPAVPAPRLRPEHTRFVEQAPLPPVPQHVWPSPPQVAHVLLVAPRTHS